MDNDLFTMEALAQPSDAILPSSPPLADGNRIFVHPIRAYNDKQGTYETLGVAKILFSPREAMPGLRDLDRMILLALVGSILAGLALAWLIAAWLTHPLTELAESIHQRRMGQPVTTPGAPFREWADLFGAIERILEEKER
jgi:HAMP domain-containing protein